MPWKAIYSRYYSGVNKYGTWTLKEKMTQIKTMTNKELTRSSDNYEILQDPPFVFNYFKVCIYLTTQYFTSKITKKWQDLNRKLKEMVRKLHVLMSHEKSWF